MAELPSSEFSPSGTPTLQLSSLEILASLGLQALELHNPEPQASQVPASELPSPKLSHPELPSSELSPPELPSLELSPPQLPPLHNQITAPELNQHLRQIAMSTRAYVHPRVISFPTDATCLNWQNDMPDSADRGVFSNLWRPGHPNRVAYFSTWVASRVGQPPDQWDKWHAWGAALLNNPPGTIGKHFFIYSCDLNNLLGTNGKHLLIYDCDSHHPNPDLRAKTLLIGTMYTLFNQARNKYAIHSLWFGCGRYPAPIGQGLCVNYTMSWLEDIATQLESPFSGSSDPKFKALLR